MNERKPVGLTTPYRKPAGGMKCPQCGAATDVKATRTKDNVVRRSRMCFNEHTFTTLETVEKKE